MTSFSPLLQVVRSGLLVGLLALAAHARAAAPLAPQSSDPNAWRLLPQAQVRAEGVHLNELVETASGPLPHIRLAAAPAVGQAPVYTRAQVTDWVRQAAPELVNTNWCGAAQVKVVRRMRLLEESEMKELLTTTLQSAFVKERGELELRLSRPWTAMPIADEIFTVNILDLPTAGITPNFIVRFELRAGKTLLGNWQLPVQAKIWREVWVAGSPLQRGQSLRNADVTRERRDVLSLRDALPALELEDASLEISENIPAGSPLTARSLRHRPIVFRGHLVEAVVQEGGLLISVKAELLEDGLPGQWVRARNLKSKREFRGKVQNEETILVAL